MADFDLDFLLASAITLVVTFAFALGFLVGEGGGEEGGGVEVCLEVAESLGGGDTRGFVNGLERGSACRSKSRSGISVPLEHFGKLLYPFLPYPLLRFGKSTGSWKGVGLAAHCDWEL
jgi:hypothetical protein